MTNTLNEFIASLPQNEQDEIKRMTNELIAGKIDRITLRLPEDLHKLLTEMAKDENRSLNAQIVYMLGAQVRASKRFKLFSKYQNDEISHEELSRLLKEQESSN